MSIFIIRGPEATGRLIRTPVPLPSPVLKSLVHRAIDAGSSVAIRACGSEQELLDALRVADHCHGEVILLDPGACVGSARLQRLLPLLRNAYVEVHDDDARAPEMRLPADVGQRIGVACGYCAQSYMHALEIALDHLGCSEMAGGVHVGT